MNSSLWKRVNSWIDSSQKHIPSISTQLLEILSMDEQKIQWLNLSTGKLKQESDTNFSWLISQLENFNDINLSYNLFPLRVLPLKQLRQIFLSMKHIYRIDLSFIRFCEFDLERLSIIFENIAHTKRISMQYTNLEWLSPEQFRLITKHLGEVRDINLMDIWMRKDWT